MTIPGCTVEAAAVEPTPEVAPSDRDPWAPAAVSEYHHGPSEVVHVSPRGKVWEVSYESSPWSSPVGSDGFELAAYDLAAFAPGTDAPPPWLLVAAESEAAPSEVTWFHALAERIVAAVGHEAWPEPETRLAWDAGPAILYVRQDALGHRRVEKVLSTLPSMRLGTVRLAVTVGTGPGGAPETLEVDVPWDWPAHAHTGVAWAYLQDFDVEISTASCVSDPIVGFLDTGLTLQARRVESSQPSGTLEVEVSCQDSVPRFPSFTTSLASSSWPVTIELPETTVSGWRGRLPAVPGTHSVVMDDGREAYLTVKSVWLGPEIGRTFVRHVLPLPSSAPEPATRPARARFAFAWEQPGSLAQGELAFADAEVLPGLRLGGARSTWSTRDAPLDASARQPSWPIADGGVSLEAHVLALEGMDLVDVVIGQSGPAIDIRRLETSCGTYKGVLSLPVCPARTDSRRVVLVSGREASVLVPAVGGGTARLTLRRTD